MRETPLHTWTFDTLGIQESTCTMQRAGVNILYYISYIKIRNSTQVQHRLKDNSDSTVECKLKVNSSLTPFEFQPICM